MYEKLDKKIKLNNAKALIVLKEEHLDLKKEEGIFEEVIE